MKIKRLRIVLLSTILGFALWVTACDKDPEEVVEDTFDCLQNGNCDDLDGSIPEGSERTEQRDTLRVEEF
ncbi:hypothetical protein [Maribacter arenosus]|uniref:Entry exclusion lipoprotein TrbK n=1 Tax=Maribacter arenosus TaxID=1854708 RepID=A0ABR7VDS3_9FLAO|nr:hypothetical protein [Maribacter arenosus]MBD0850468.1 hypothetical protein [Maribacter arenosus]